MRRTLYYILGALMVAMVGAVAVSCEASDEFAPKQREQIERYLNNNSLIPYRLTSDSVFVYVASNNLPEEEQTRIAKGDQVEFNFEAYTFGSSPASLPYYTNKEWLAAKLGDVIDTSWWDFEPMRAYVGDGSIIKGLDSALPDCSKGDSVVVFLTSSNAYGGNKMGVVPANTALMMVLNILDVEKQ